MRVLYDISTLGLGHLYQQSRGGSYRVDRHLAEGLAASGECELSFCANHSTVAYHGCEAFLAQHPDLARIPLLAPRRSRAHASIRAAASAAHRSARRIFGTNVLPGTLRHCAALVDAHLHPPVAGAASGVDIFHAASTPLPAPSDRHSPKRFLTVYDLSYLRFPEMYGAAYRRSTTAALDSLGPGDRIFTASHFIRDELCERGIASADRIHVVPLAADPALFATGPCDEAVSRVRERYAIPEGPYALSVNSADPRKNVPHAIHAFARATRASPAVVHSLVLSGSPGPGAERIRDAIGAYPDLRGRIVQTGHVPDADLGPLYTGARVFVYPSIYEGFGLPPLEAMQCGTPAITSNTSSLPEVVGDAGVMVPPDDVDALAGAMLDLARDSDRRRCLRERGLAQAGRFSWEQSTAATLRAYRTALAG